MSLGIRRLTGPSSSVSMFGCQGTPSWRPSSILVVTVCGLGLCAGGAVGGGVRAGAAGSGSFVEAREPLCVEAFTPLGNNLHGW